MRKVNDSVYAPAGRAHPRLLAQQKHIVESEAQKDIFLEGIHEGVTVLNQERQIVFANSRILEQLNCSVADLLGKRPGEAFDCVHADETDGGCGTTRFCRECGAVNAILSAQGSHAAVEECRILRKDGTALDLEVRTTPVKIGAEKFTLFALRDIAQEKRREALEQTLFHDLLNTAGVIHNASVLLKDHKGRPEVFTKMIERGATQLIEEILSHRQLLEAEKGEMELQLEEINPVSLLLDVVSAIENTNLTSKKYIKVESGATVDHISSDKSILRRVLHNLLKNALEATFDQGVVLTGCEASSDGVLFYVHNDSVMSEKVKHQVFQRSFSTKGPGRGIGTFSIKLFVENYLGGKVWFESKHDKGTTFFFNIPNSA